jgi:hypothetical protein
MRKKLGMEEKYLHDSIRYRIVHRFLWRRKILQDEARWLEFAYILQENMNAPMWLESSQMWFTSTRKPEWEDRIWAN